MAQKIVFVRSHGLDNKDLYVANADGSSIAQLTSSPTFEGTPAWSPDGGTIAFTNFINDFKAYLWTMNTDWSHERQLTRGQPGMDLVPSWSADGERIVFERHFDGSPDSASADLFVMNADGSHIVRLTREHARNPAWSPDGTKIAFWADTKGDPIRILDLGSGKETTLVDADAVTTVGKACGVVPTWSPDGMEIAWTGCEQQPTDLYIMRVDGTGLSTIPNTSGSSDPAWEPPGTGT